MFNDQRSTGRPQGAKIGFIAPLRIRVYIIMCRIVGVFFASLLFFSSALFATKPNVIVFFVDDMGYRELSCNDSPDIRTPNIDSLATNGVRCTAGYVSAPICGPSRAGLMTGHYQTQFGYEANPKDQFRDSFGLDLNYQTLGDRMQAAGYKTGAIGKWDLGRSVAHHPRNRGFDFYYGHIIGARNFWPMQKGPEHIVLTRGPGEKVKETKYLTHQLTDGALEFLDTYQRDPFFLYVAYNAPHSPFQATDEDLARNSHIENEKRRILAGMITALDDGLGAILEKLRELNQEEETLIFFVSDNGSPSGHAPYKEFLGENNLPFSGGKGNLFEGGIRVPFIVQWKGGNLPIGTTCDTPVSSLDLMPTLLNLTSADVPSDLPGMDILPLLTGESTEPRNLYWRFNGSYAVRSGDWKWVHDAKSDRTQLFNLADDIGEHRDLLKSHPEKASELEALWRKWNRQNVAPLWQKPAVQKRLKQIYGGEGMGAVKQ